MMIKVYDWHYEKVPRLGTVIFSPEAMESLKDNRVGPIALADALEYGTDTRAPVGAPVLGYRDHRDIRLEFKTWRHMPGAAALCVNGYRVK